MPEPRVRLAVRDWDHVMPLLIGDVRPEGAELALDLRDQTPTVLAEPAVDGGETSLSRYVLARASGDDRLIGLPVFLMRGFRHRCILVPAKSELTRLDDLRGRRVGLTGWPDSGNTWTRELVRAAGVNLADIEWVVGSMDGAPVDPHRLGTNALPPNVRSSAGGRSLVDDLVLGELDAIMTPFMPSSIFEADPPVRHLLSDYRADELRYYRRHGFIPGMHLLTVRRQVADRHPWLPRVLVDAFDRSKRAWWERRRLLCDTTPWLLADLEETATVFGADWMPSGVTANRAMVSTFATELFEQGIAPRQVTADELFDADLFADEFSAGVTA